MRISIYILAIVLAMSSSLSADLKDPDRDKDVFTSFAINGKFYHAVKLVSVKDGICVLDSKEGEVKAPWNSLPSTFQRYNKGKKEYLEEELKKEEATRKLETETPQMHLEVLQVLGDGVLADPLKYQPGYSRASRLGSVGGGGGVASGDSSTYELSGKTIFVKGLSGLADNSRVAIRAKRDGVYSYQDISGVTRTLEKWIFTEKLTK